MIENFQITQTYSFVDLFISFLHSLRKIKIAKNIFLVVTIASAVAALSDIVSPHKQPISWYTPVLKIIFGPVFILTLGIVFGSIGILVTKLFYSNKVNDLNFAFNHWGMVLSGKGFEVSKPWSHFKEYKQTNRFIELFSKDGNSYLIKKGAFATKNELTDFLAFISEKL